MSTPVTLLRSKLRDLGVQAYFLPHNDSHNNEYLSTADMRMPFLSGFSGSSGHLLITQESAFLYTDGRYWLSAETQLFPEWTLMKLAPGVPRYFEWITQNLAKGSIIAYDSSIVSYESVKLRKEYFEKKGFEFRGLNLNPVNDIWTNRPEYSQDLIFRLSDEYAGKSAKAKVEEMAQKMNEKYLFTNALDEIAWLLNLRGTDIEYNPVFFSYLVLEKGERNVVHLFVRKGKIAGLEEYFNENSVIVYDYSEIEGFLKGITEKVEVDQSKCNELLYLSIAQPVNGKVNISDLKSIKNSREIQGFRDSHIRDGAAVCKYFAWLEEELKNNQSWNEFSAALKLEELRRNDPLNRGLSFGTISSVGANAAVIHYKPTETDAKVLTTSEIYLLDSGGHYLDGTIDTTRTVHFGAPKAEEKDAYTRVLLGNLDLERMIWPESWDISGAELDIMARRRLWAKGLDYNHGTGHGVGYFLNVHEGPQGISRARKVTLKPGMNVTNEPGYYKAGEFGIRIENVMFVRKCEGIEGFLSFENVTMVPYHKGLIEESLLSKDDKNFINEYHNKIWQILSPIIESTGDQLTLQWLKRNTSPLE